MTYVGYGLPAFTGRWQCQPVAWAWGYGGQFSLLVPNLKLAVATAATSPRPSELREQAWAAIALVDTQATVDVLRDDPPWAEGSIVSETPVGPAR